MKKFFVFVVASFLLFGFVVCSQAQDKKVITWKMQATRKLPYKVDSLKLEFPVYRCITSHGVMCSSESCGLSSL